MPRQGFGEFAGLPEHQVEPLLRRQAAQVGQLEFQISRRIIGRKFQDAACAAISRSLHGHLIDMARPE
jgi:hypothetical protein